MKSIAGTIGVTLLIWSFGYVAVAQSGAARPRSAAGAANAPCLLAGAYRIDVAESDKLYSVVSGATSTVPFGDQQRFFMDLSVRLTPPDLLAIECRGPEVSVGSSRAERVTFIADGKSRRERTPGGSLVYSRVLLRGGTLTFTSTGKAEDNLRVRFESLENGRRLRVTRSIYAEQLTQPIVIQTIYDKIADKVNWETYRDTTVAQQAPVLPDVPKPASANTSQTTASRITGREAAALRSALDEWIDATNRKDIDSQMSFYMPRLQAFYLTRNTPSRSVRLEKERVFRGVRSVDISTEDPEIVFQESGRVAVMRFRKRYRIVERNRTRSGEVVQELRWQKTPQGWRIFSERDVRVIT